MQLYKYLWVAVIGVGLLLQLHNARMYNPLYGFDGQDHIEYLQYLQTNRRIPLPHEGWQFYQTPLYYLLAQPVYNRWGVKGVQAQNVIYYAVFIAAASWLISRILGMNQWARLIAVLALTALPVVNYLVPMVSNEFLNDAFVGLSVLWLCLLPAAKRSDQRLYVGIALLLFVIGFYTKYTMLTILPTYGAALWLMGLGKENGWKQFVVWGVVSAAIGLAVTSPIYLRNLAHYRTPLAMADQFFPIENGRVPRTWRFYVDVSWIPKVDLFQAQHYSLSGGTWNSFWHEGYQATVPVVAFHKKAFGLWLLGFPLTVLALVGFWQLKKRRPKVFGVAVTYLITSITAYAWYNYQLPYPSETKAFFLSGLPAIYALALGACYLYTPKTRAYLGLMLTLQLILMFSYFWMQSWWHVAR
ncbi:MAG: hypothetical protein ACD_40C00113G0002 [uncultured bacterium]|nr:MAG: hypothetical protein ACD_40C00113G0002 [uncultured bacterium]